MSQLFALLRLGCGGLLLLVSSVTMATVDVNQSFNPINIQPGQSSDYEITFFNSNPNFSITNLALTDILPTNVLISSLVSNSCGGTVSIVPSTQVAISGGAIPIAVGGSSGICKIKVTVSSATPGTYVNSIAAGDVTGLENGVPLSNPVAAQATLAVSSLSPLTGSKTRLPTTIHIGGVSTFTITINNPNVAPLTGLSFTDNLPIPLKLATPLAVGGTCVTVGGGSISAVAGGTSVSLSGAALAASGSCTVTLQVIVDPTYTVARNSSVTNSLAVGAVTTTQGASNSAIISVGLTLQTGAAVTKVFSPSTVFIGQTSTLTLTFLNYNPTAISGFSFTDAMPAGIVVLSANTTCSGGVASFTPTSVSVTNATVAAAPNLNASSSGACTLTATVQATSAGSLVNAVPAGNLNGINFLAASGTLNTLQTVGVSKSFSPNSVPQGNNSTLTIVFSNTSGVSATISSFSDNLTTMGSGFTIRTGASTTCGGSLTATAGATLISLSGGTIPAGSTCTITVPIAVATNATTGTRTNSIAAGAMVTSQGSNPLAATANLTVTTTASIAKTFLPATVAPGGISTLQITVTRASGANAFTSINITDPLPSGHVVATPPNASNTCGGTLGAAAGSSSVTLTGGTLSSGAGATSCVIRVDIKAPTGTGSATNTISIANFSVSDGTSTFSDTTNRSATLTRQNSSMLINKAFNPVSANGGAGIEAQVTFSNNQSGAIALSNVALTDNLPPNVVVYGPANATFTGAGCTSGTITAVPGANSFALSGATIAVGSVCTLSVRVTSSFDGNHINSLAAGSVSSKEGVTNSNAVSATMTVQRNVNAIKFFTPRILVVGANSVLTIRLTNSNTTLRTLTAAAGVTDNLPAGMTIKSPLVAGDITTTCSGPAFNAASDIIASAGGSSIVINDAQLAAGGSCDVNVPVQIASTGSYVNTIATGAMQTVEGSTNPDSATDTLTGINPATITKAFSPSSIPVGASSTITFTLSNPNSTALLPGGLTNASFSDALTGMAINSNQSAAGTCSGASGNSFVDGQTSLSFSGLTIPGGSPGTCTVTVTVLASTPGIFPNTALNLITSQTPVGVNSNTPSLTVVAERPSISKAFSPAAIALGQTSTLTFTLNNPNAVVATLPSSNAFSDVFPTSPGAMIVSSPLTVSNTCGSTVRNSSGGTLAAGAVGIRLDGGSIPANSSCTVSVKVSANTPGTYANTSTVLTSSNAGSSLSPATANLSIDPPILNVTKSVNPNPVDTGNPAVYTITVQNTAAQAVTVGNLTITDDLATGITLNDTNGSSPGWSCLGTTELNCTFSNSLAAGASTTLLLNVSIGSGTLTGDNTARVAGGGDPQCPAVPIPASARCSGTVLASTVPVVLSDISAEVQSGQLVVRFGTLTEAGTLGFRVLAGGGNLPRLPIDENLTPSVGMHMSPQRYEIHGPHRDQTQIWIEELTIRGKSIAYGPFAVGSVTGRPADPSAIDWPAISAEQDAFNSQQLALLRSSSGNLEAEARVDGDGWVRVSFEDLLAQGIDWSGIPTSNIHVRLGEREVQRLVDGGESFAPGGAIRFLGHQINGSLYTRTAVYRISTDNSGAQSIGTVSGGATRNLPIQSIRERFEHAPSRAYTFTSPGDDPWYALRIMRNGPGISANETFVLSDRAATSTDERIEVEIWGGLNFPEEPDHSVRIRLNGTQVATASFDGLSRQRIQATLPQGVLLDGNNVLTLELVADTGLPYDLIQLKAIRIDYDRELRARQDRIDFKLDDDTVTSAGADRLFADAFNDEPSPACALAADCSDYVVSGLTRTDLLALRERDGRVEQLSGLRIEGTTGNYQARFASTRQPGDRYRLTPADGSAPLALAPRQAPADPIAGGSGQMLIISHPSFVERLGPLVAARQAEGLSVRVVTVDTLYQRYTEGVIDPSAIQQAIADAYQRIGTRYVLLVGGDTYDYFDYAGSNSISFIPTHYRQTDPYVIRFGVADNVHGDINGDGLMDVAIGRFPVRSNTELDQVIVKTLAYPQADHGRRLLLQADRADPLEFDQQLVAIADMFGSNWTTTQLSLDNYPTGATGTAQARSDLSSAVNSGQALTVFMGHSSPDRWTFSGLLSAADIYNGIFSNVGRPTVVWSLGCYGSYFVQPNYNTIAHAMMLQPGAGAAALLGASELTEVSSDVAWINTMLLYLPQERLGDAMMLSQRLLRLSGPQFDDIGQGGNLLGDPTLRLRQ